MALQEKAKKHSLHCSDTLKKKRISSGLKVSSAENLRHSEKKQKIILPVLPKNIFRASKILLITTPIKNAAHIPYSLKEAVPINVFIAHIL